MSVNTYIPFSEQDKLRASEVDLVLFLQCRGERLERAGNNHKLIYTDGSGTHDSITVSGNKWFDHKNKCGGGPIKFLRYPLSAIYHNGKKINYHSFINSLEFRECNQALLRIAPRVDTEKINALVDETPYISDVQRTFYKAFIGARFEKIIAPAYKKVLEMNEEITQNTDMDFGMKM